MIKDQLVMLQQESQIICSYDYVCTEDEASKRHMREEQERIKRDEIAKQELEIEKKDIGIKIQVRS